MIAAERFRTLWQSANADGLNAIDYRRQRVDGRGSNLLGVTDSRLWARQKLERIRRALGRQQFHVLVIAAGNEQNLEDVRAWLRCRATAASDIVKDALNNLSMLSAAKGAGYGLRSIVGSQTDFL